MIKISLKLHGVERLGKYLAARPREVGAAISRAIKKSGFILESESKKALTTGPTRAIRTGLLRSQNVVRELSDIRAAVYPLVDYALYVHEGTFKMRARPWFQAAAKEAGPKIREAFEEEIEHAMTG